MSMGILLVLILRNGFVPLLLLILIFQSQRFKNIHVVSLSFSIA